MAQVSVVWLPEALDDLQRLYDFIYDKDAAAAGRAASQILKAAAIVKAMPRVGRPMPVRNAQRELFIPFNAGAYVLRYRFLEDTKLVAVTRVWHSREDRLGVTGGG